MHCGEHPASKGGNHECGHGPGAVGLLMSSSRMLDTAEMATVLWLLFSASCSNRRRKQGGAGKG